MHNPSDPPQSPLRPRPIPHLSHPIIIWSMIVLISRSKCIDKSMYACFALTVAMFLFVVHLTLLFLFSSLYKFTLFLSETNALNLCYHKCTINLKLSLRWQIARNVWPTNVPLPTCYNAEFGRSTLHGVGMNIVNPKIGSAGTLFSGDGRRGWSSDTHPSPTCVNEVKFRSSVTKGVCINRTEPPKLGIAGAPAPAWGHDYPHKYDASYICWNCRIWSF